MVIRDLTLRSAASFGSFHLIRLLFDEYMFYLVEHKVAVATSKTPIAIMSEVSNSAHYSIMATCCGHSYDCITYIFTQFSGITSTAVSDGTGVNPTGLL